MNPSPNRQAVVVGLFVAVGVTILAGGILTIGDLNDTFTRKVTVTAVFDEVGGLQRGDNVWFSGVKVGVVRKLGFLNGSPVEVEMRIDEDAMRYIHDDSLAKIGSDGLIGSRIVVIYGGSAGAPALQHGDVLAVGTAVSTEDILATLQANNTNLLAITTDLKTISGTLAAGEGTVGKLLGDDALYTKVTDTVTSLDAASTNAGSLTASLSDFAGKLNQEGGLPHELVTDRTSYAALTGTVGRIQHAGQRASDLMDGLARGAGDESTPVGTMMHDEEAGADLRATLDNLSRSSLLLSENLEAVQHNFLLRRYFRKKEKARREVDADPGEPAAPVAGTE